MQHFNLSGQNIENKDQLQQFYLKSYAVCDQQIKKCIDFMKNFETYKNDIGVRNYIIETEKNRFGDKLQTPVIDGVLNSTLSDEHYLELFFNQQYLHFSKEKDKFSELMLTYSNLLYDLNKQS